MTDRRAGLSRGFAAMWGAIMLLIALPFIAMQFTDEVNWSSGDFAILALLLVGGGSAYGALVRRNGHRAYHLASAIAILASVLLVIVTGAVGIIGAESDDANLLFPILPAIGLIGALMVRFREAALARLFLAIAGLQFGIGLLALGAGWGREAAAWPYDIIAATAIFAAFWLAAAALFRRAARAGAASSR